MNLWSLYSLGQAVCVFWSACPRLVLHVDSYLVYFIQTSERLPLLPDSFGQLSTQHDIKWMELFSHARTALGCQGQKPGTNECENAWEKVAVIFANLRAKQTKR